MTTTDSRPGVQGRGSSEPRVGLSPTIDYAARLAQMSQTLRARPKPEPVLSRRVDAPVPVERGEKAAALAREVVGAVHFGTRKDVALLLHRQDLVALTVALAAMVDPDRSVGELLAWVEGQEPKVPASHLEPRRPSTYRPVETLTPCGTHAAFVRHKNRCEDIDEACRLAEREYQRNRRRKPAEVAA